MIKVGPVTIGGSKERETGRKAFEPEASELALIDSLIDDRNIPFNAISGFIRQHELLRKERRESLVEYARNERANRPRGDGE